MERVMRCSRSACDCAVAVLMARLPCSVNGKYEENIGWRATMERVMRCSQSACECVVAVLMARLPCSLNGKYEENIGWRATMERVMRCSRSACERVVAVLMVRLPCSVNGKYEENIGWRAWGRWEGRQYISPTGQGRAKAGRHGGGGRTNVMQAHQAGRPEKNTSPKKTETLKK
ncbi:hypothetical protein CBR_g761 [Chara braunii]|uniref:Uncharacterized protein n=1 Tax=Chara braunii TaxID=69332 RepID=A0A388KC39_CHABU|nr:hypothetical protein CBR_g761 [Chara braunii]|eukprot:GBG67632.1 hypothetical protein CBR_g761 [Chara braunii]